MQLAFTKDSPGVSDSHVNAPIASLGPVLLGGRKTDDDLIDEANFEGHDKTKIIPSITKGVPQSLYISRAVLNADEIIAWAKSVGFETTYPADEMHVTIAFSRSPVDWMAIGQACWSIDGKADLMVPEGGPRQLEIFGLKQNCAVLLFASSELQWRHSWIVEEGASWDWPEYTPHITISQSLPDGFDPSTITPYQGAIHLGPELFQPVKENAMDGIVEKGFETFFKVAGVDEDLGLVFGWGIVCKEHGQDYYDVQKNHIPEPAMVHATTDFMKGQRMAGEQHMRMDAGSIVHSFPLTGEIWKAMFTDHATGAMMGGLPESPPKSGWMVASAPDAAMLKKFKSGELTGFSIGGEHIEVNGKAIQVSE